MRAPLANPSFDPHDRVVALRDHTLLERNDRVVSDLYPFRTHVTATFGDIAHAQTHLILQQVEPIVRVEGMHLQLGVPDEHPRTSEARDVLLVVTGDVANVLAQEAFDALVELLHAIDVSLLHSIRAVGVARPRLELRYALGHLEVQGNVGHEVADDGKRAHWRQRDRLLWVEQIHTRHAHQSRLAVHLRAARTAFTRFAVPANGQIVGLIRLDAVHHIEH